MANPLLEKIDKNSDLVLFCIILAIFSAASLQNSVTGFFPATGPQKTTQYRTTLTDPKHSALIVEILVENPAGKKLEQVLVKAKASDQKITMSPDQIMILGMGAEDQRWVPFAVIGQNAFDGKYELVFTTVAFVDGEYKKLSEKKLFFEKQGNEIPQIYP